MNIEEFEKLSREAMVDYLRRRNPDLVRGKTRAKKSELVDIFRTDTSATAAAEFVEAAGGTVVAITVPESIDLSVGASAATDSVPAETEAWDPTHEIEESGVEPEAATGLPHIEKVPTELIVKAAEWSRLPYSNRKSKRVKRAVGIKLDKSLRKFGVNLQQVVEAL